MIDTKNYNNNSGTTTCNENKNVIAIELDNTSVVNNNNGTNYSSEVNNISKTIIQTSNSNINNITSVKSYENYNNITINNNTSNISNNKDNKKSGICGVGANSIANNKLAWLQKIALHSDAIEGKLNAIIHKKITNTSFSQRIKIIRKNKIANAKFKIIRRQINNMGKKRRLNNQQTEIKKFKNNSCNIEAATSRSSMEIDCINQPQQPKNTTTSETAINKNEEKTTNNNDTKIPPIIVHNNGNIKINEFILETKKIDFNVKYKLTNNKIIVYATNIDKHNKIVNLLKVNEREFHTFSIKSLKSKKYVIKGLYKMPTEDITHFFRQKNIIIEKIAIMKQKVETNCPFYYIAISSESPDDEIKKIRHIFNIAVTIEKYHNKTNVTQCYNCQKFGHGSSTCYFNPACLKCAGHHETKSCTKTLEEKPRCANCNGEHPANFSGCMALLNYKNFIQNKTQTRITKQNTFNIQEVEFPNITNHPKNKNVICKQQQNNQQQQHHQSQQQVQQHHLHQHQKQHYTPQQQQHRSIHHVLQEHQQQNTPSYANMTKVGNLTTNNEDLVHTTDLVEINEFIELINNIKEIKRTIDIKNLLKMTRMLLNITKNKDNKNDTNILMDLVLTTETNDE